MGGTAWGASRDLRIFYPTHYISAPLPLDNRWTVRGVMQKQ